MKAPPAAPALLATLLAAGCASSDWAKVERVPGGKLYVPKLYAPLLPGSIYPDKKTPVPARARPVLVLVCPEKGDCRRDEVLDRAAQRGFVVLGGREPKVDLLRTRAEADTERIGWLFVEPTGDFLRRWNDAGAPGAAIAILWTAPRAAGPGIAPLASPAPPLPSSPSRKIFLATSPDAAPPAVTDATVLKLYSPNKTKSLPPEAFRDAVEWLAGELGAR